MRSLRPSMARRLRPLARRAVEVECQADQPRQHVAKSWQKDRRGERGDRQVDQSSHMLPDTAAACVIGAVRKKLIKFELADIGWQRLIGRRGAMLGC